MQDNFMIEITPTNFYTQTDDDGTVRGTAYVSCGARMSYSAADHECQKLREQGYVGAMVTDRFGQPVLPADLQSERRYSIAVGEKFFAGRNEGGQILVSILEIEAKRFSKPVAVELLKRLHDAGCYGAQIVRNSRGQAAYDNDELKAAWGEIIPEKIHEPEVQGTHDIS